MQAFCPFSFLQFTFQQTPFKTLLHVVSIFNTNASHNSFLHEHLCWHLINLLVFSFFFFSSNKLSFSRFFFCSIDPCACVAWTTLLNFFDAVSLIENNSGKTSSGVKGVLNGLIVKVVYSQFSSPMLKTTGWFHGQLSLSSFQGWSNKYFNWSTTSYCFNFLKNLAWF